MFFNKISKKMFWEFKNIKRYSVRPAKFFSENDENDSEYLKGKVQIMTMHKSKGDEFNLVFMPEMTEKNLPLAIESINLKSSEFIESVKKVLI